MNAEQVREYLRDLDGLWQEICDLSADIAQYDAMLPEPSGQPERTWYLSKLHNKTFSNTLIRPMGSPRMTSNVVERLVIIKISHTEKMQKRLNELWKINMAIRFVYNYISDFEREVWHCKYLKGWTHSRIARELETTADVVKHTDSDIVRDIVKNYEIRQK
jgi:hypothetical protein